MGEWKMTPHGFWDPDFETRCTKTLHVLHGSMTSTSICMQVGVYIHIYNIYIYISTPPSFFMLWLPSFDSIHIHPQKMLQLRSSLSWLLGCTGGPSAKRLLPQVELRVIRLRRLPWLVVRATAKLLLRADITPWKRSDSEEDLEMATSLTRHRLC